jgi:putative membrane-bound dehydrogenase-like protein
MIKTTLTAILSISLSLSVFAADPFAADVRTTEPVTPAEQQKSFKPLPGFEVQLITGDPEIAKPFNLAFDARGRLWVTDSHVYPFPAKDVKKDAIKVIELGEDGHAKKITVFADHLNIPIGIYPIGDGSKVIAYDINNVCLYTDTDGDGKSDKREVLYSGWGYERDTHGMASNFRRGFDGWLYGCHGFNNLSDVVAKGGGPPVHMQSGNTYRMRLDGSRIEMFTVGQINPYGMSMDPLGNIYTSDSHSKPIYQLLRGGRYEAFDRNTDDGLGLAPAMMSHLHGSTAIAGSCFYAAEQFPEEFRGNVFVGNVVTSRLNRDKLEYHGSTPKAIEQPDLLTTADPWFRPVNTILGPDGALYIADFYNRIIGHYEVKLDHPGRDFERGRIWRLSYKTPNVAPFDISKADAKELIEKLADPNLLVRQLATDQLSDRVGKDAIEPIGAMLKAGDARNTQKIHGLWVLYRIGAVQLAHIETAAKDPDASVRVHAMRMLAETHDWTAEQRELALGGLNDSDALVRRCAADALGQHPDVNNVRPLFDALVKAQAADTHLIYVLRMAARNQLRADGSFGALSNTKLSDQEVQFVADAALSVPTSDAAAFLLARVGMIKDRNVLIRALRHVVRYAAGSSAEPLTGILKERFADDLDLQTELFSSLRSGLAQRGEPLPPAARAWGEELVAAVLKADTVESTWTAKALEPGAPTVNPWAYETRKCADGQSTTLLSTLPGGEKATGILRSAKFAAPAKLSFYVCGHNGDPNSPEVKKNIVRLRDGSDNSIIEEVVPPRNDVAKQINWDLSKVAGQQVYLEFIDADTGNAYAWLAFGRINPPVVAMPKAGSRSLQERLRLAAQLAGELPVPSAANDLLRVLADHGNDTETRIAVAGALAAIKDDAAVPAMKQIIGDANEIMQLRDRVATALGVMATPAAQNAIVESFRLAPRELQTALAIALTSNTSAAETLLTAVADGKAPAPLLLELGIHDRLAAAKVPDLDKRVKELTRGVAAPKEKLDKLIADRRSAFKSAHPSPPSGEAVFAKNCVQCHQVDGKGGVVGPQLVGLSKRGVDRLVEDILDPNRNVDPAFRYSTLILKDGRLITGLQKRVEGEVLVFNDTTGKEVAVEKKQIRQRIESPSSLMPSNFDEIIRPEEFNNLVAYLLSK